MTFHCSHVDRDRGTVAVCPREAVIVWRDKDGVAHGYCVEDLRQGHVEAIKNGWVVAESALERVA